MLFSDDPKARMKYQKHWGKHGIILRTNEILQDKSKYLIYLVVTTCAQEKAYSHQLILAHDK